MMDFILVVGSQRSGTTLMGQIIGAHPQAVMIDENDGLYDWTNALFNRPPNADPEILFNNCCLSAMTKYQNPQKRFLDNGLLRDTVEIVVLKAPNLTYSYQELPKDFSGARIIYMFRDIRDVVSSMMALKIVPILNNQLRRIFSYTELEQMFPDELSLLRQENNTVKPHVKMALVAKIKMSFSKQFQDIGFEVTDVRYEDLISNPEQIIPQILDEISIPFAEECLHHDQFLRGSGPGGTHRYRPIDTISMGNWRNNLTHQQGLDIWEMVGDFMIDLGYTK